MPSLENDMGGDNLFFFLKKTEKGDSVTFFFVNLQVVIHRMRQ